jgi:SAM-dependent methyltransferase
MTNQSRSAWADQFNRVFVAPSRRGVEARVWRAVYGDEYPAEADPYSFTTRSELARIARELRVGPGHTVADIGCGRGGPGLWVAQATGADLVGVDIAATALGHAARRAEQLGLAARTRFQEGEFAATGLGSESMDGVMSIDVLLFAPDKAAAAEEIARVLRPDARFVFTSWDCHAPLRERPPQVDDHRPLLEAAGFAVEVYEETPEWERHQRALAEGMLAAREDVAAEEGAAAAERMVAVVTIQLENLAAMRRRVLVVARKVA